MVAHKETITEVIQVVVVFVMLYSHYPPVLYWSMRIVYVRIRKRVRLLKRVAYCCWLNPNHPWLNP